MVVAEVRAMEGWLPDNFELAGGGLACFSPTLWDSDASAASGDASLFGVAHRHHPVLHLLQHVIA